VTIGTGATFDHYEILTPLGTGGMGEVYRARDSRLNREVAIKVLPREFSRDDDRLRRFAQEARATSALNHPNILTVHDVGTHEGTPYIVLELLAGEELRAHLNEGAPPVRKALDYARQIAAGLAAAHEKGIVHRDLKPENLFITTDGRVKILDFGLAKLQESGTHEDGSRLPTQRAMTGPGVVLGTVGYMSPEQVRGGEADHRSDIFSFGAVLYEMLAGRRCFQRDTQAETLTAILREEPPDLSQPTSVSGSPALEKIVRRCLDKKPEHRFQTATDLGFALEALSASTAPRIDAVAPRGSSRRDRLAWTTAAVSLLGAMVLAWAFFVQPPAAATEAVKLHFVAPPNTNFGSSAISPDGRWLAFTAATEGQVQLWMRALDTTEARVVAGTEGATFPFWSPDSRFVAFFAGGKLKKLEVSAASAQTLCDAGIGWGGAWNREGVILYGSVGFGIFRVPATGGSPTLVVQFDASQKEWNLSSPSFLPDGRKFLYYMQSAVKEVRGIYVSSLDDPAKRRLLDANSNVVFTPSGSGDAGFLLFEREGALVAQAFDAATLQTTGEPFSVAEQVGKEIDFNRASFSVSDTGVLVYDPNSKRQAKHLVWVDRSGKQIRTLGDTGGWGKPGLSPDESRVAIDRTSRESGLHEIYIFDASTAAGSRFTFDPADNIFPVWSPDLTRIVWGSSREGVFDLYWKPASGAGRDERIAKSAILTVPNDWSRDGRFIAYYEVNQKTRRDLGIISVSDRKPSIFLQTDANEVGAQFSPDGRWIAYSSDESGAYEVYVRSFPDAAGKWQVSTRGGAGPIWRRDGKELYYYAPDGKLMSVAVKSGAGFETGAPAALFGFRSASIVTVAPYAASADGQRFLLNTVVDESGNAPLTVVLNWTAGLKQ
jgi:eukaryotic-like serine/threonine-protein kinase